MLSVHCEFRRLSIRYAQVRISSFLHYCVICIFTFSMKAEIAHEPVVLDQCLKHHDGVCWPKVKQKWLATA